MALGSWLLASDFRLSAMAGLFFHESRVPNVRAIYIFVMVKLPDPVQPLLPVRVQVPVMVLPPTAPDRIKVLPVGVDDCTVMPNLPVTLPLKFPPNAICWTQTWPAK